MTIYDAIPAELKDGADDEGATPTETPTDDSAEPTGDTAEPAAPAEGQPAEEPAAPRKYAGKFDDPDALEAGYANLEKSFGKFGGKTAEELAQMEADAEAFRRLSTGLPEDKTAGGEGDQVSEVLKAAGVDLSDIDWDTVTMPEYHERMQQALSSVISYMGSQIPAIVAQHIQNIEDADAEVGEWEAKEPLLKNPEFRDMVADLTEKNVPIGEAVATVRERWSKIAKDARPAPAPAATPAKPAGVVPKGGGGQATTGDRPAGIRGAFEQAEDETGIRIAPVS